MTPRPLIKWKSFWLGILVLGFLGWAWWDSYRIDTHVQFSGAEDVGAFVMSKGISTFYFCSGAAGPDEAFYFGRESTGGAVAAMREIASVMGYTRLDLPNSLVLIPSIVLWLAWLFFHWKREQKKAAP